LTKLQLIIDGGVFLTHGVETKRITKRTEVEKNTQAVCAQRQYNDAFQFQLRPAASARTLVPIAYGD